MEANDSLLTPEEVAAVLSVAPSTLVRWRRQTRRLKEPVGPEWLELGHRTVRYKRSDVQAWIAERANG